MTKRILTFVIIAIAITVLLSACERPASVAPATETPAIPFPVQQPTTNLGTLATQTAAAKGVVPTPTGQAAAKPTTAPTAGAAQPTQVPQQPPAPQPTTPPKPPAVIPTVERPSSYQIQSGDHFFCLARRFDFNPADFFALNGLGTNSQAVIGQTVRIPSGGSWPTSSGSRSLRGHPDTYTVQSGDTLNKIACLYGDVDPSGIIAVNDLKAPYSLSAGQSLQIP